MTLIEKLENVVDQSTFLEFVRALIEDWNRNEAEIERKRNANLFSPSFDDSEWESGTIGRYLEAALAWFEDKNQKRPIKNLTWRIFAEFLYAGKIYE